MVRSRSVVGQSIARAAFVGIVGFKLSVSSTSPALMVVGAISSYHQQQQQAVGEQRRQAGEAGFLARGTAKVAPSGDDA